MDYDKLFKSPLSCTICAKRNSGKTYLLKKIINEIGSRYGLVGIFTGSTDGSLEELSRKRNIVIDAEFDKGKIAELLDYIKKHVESGGKKERVLIVLDDLTDQFKLTSKDILNQLAFKSRHYGIDYIFITHRYMALSPMLRQNTTLQLFFRPPNQKEMKGICEDLETCDDTSDEIRTHLENLEQYQCLVVDKTGNKDEFFKLKA